MNSKLLPINIKNILDNFSKHIDHNDIIYDDIIYYDDNYMVIKDKVHTSSSYHYTAWCRYECKNLLEVASEDIQKIRKLINKVKLKLKSKPIIFIHFPPNYWRLHIHFVEQNHVYKANMEEIHFIDDVIRNIEQNEFYYLDRVIIQK